MPNHIVVFTEKLLKTIATRCAIFGLKFTKNRLAAGLYPDPLGELSWVELVEFNIPLDT